MQQVMAQVVRAMNSFCGMLRAVVWKHRATALDFFILPADIIRAGQPWQNPRG